MQELWHVVAKIILYCLQIEEKMENTEELTNNTNSVRTKYPNNNRKRKKKNRFLSNAKGYGKQGNYGRGTNIEEDQFQYFINVLDAMKQGFDSQEEKCAMSNNVLEQSIGKEIHYASNQVTSKALESLIGFSSEDTFFRFMEVFSQNLRPICSDPYASHVLQKIIEISFLRKIANENTIRNKSEISDKKLKLSELNDKNYNMETQFSEKHRLECGNFLVKIGKFLLNNLDEFMWDRYSSYIMRTSILCLSGIYIPKIAFEHEKDLKNFETYEVPSDWKMIAKEFGQRIELWPQFGELPYWNSPSAFLQVLCTSIKYIDKNYLKHLGKKLLMDSFLQFVDEGEDDKDKKIDIDEEDEENGNSENNAIAKENIRVPKVFHQQCSIRLLETLITLSGPKLFTQLYAMLFAGKILIFALDKNTNFAVQKIIENFKEKVDFETVFDELNDHFEEILKIGHTGVILALSKTCLRLQTKQGAFIAATQKALHTINSKEKSEQIFKCLLKLKPLEIAVEDKSNFIHLQGSLIIQNILNFNKPIFLVNSILSYSSIEIATIFSSQNGSYIADQFLESKYIGEKSREKLIKHLEGTYIDLAISKSGSRVLEKLFEYSNEKQRIQIVKELAEKINKLNSTLFGNIINSKFKVDKYKLSPASWKNTFNKNKKAEKLFEDIVK